MRARWSHRCAAQGAVGACARKPEGAMRREREKTRPSYEIQRERNSVKSTAERARTRQRTLIGHFEALPAYFPSLNVGGKRVTLRNAPYA